MVECEHLSESGDDGRGSAFPPTAVAATRAGGGKAADFMAEQT
jgi:hypothetical protein